MATKETSRPISPRKRKEQVGALIGALLGGLALIIVGSTTLGLNVIEFVRGEANNLWWLSLLFVAIFGVLPILAGIWLVSKAIQK